MDRRLRKRNIRRRHFVRISPTQTHQMSAAVPLNLSALREGASVASVDAAPQHGIAVSVVIPTLNEAAQIGQAVADLSWANARDRRSRSVAAQNSKSGSPFK